MIFLQAGLGSAAQFLPLALIFVVFYFFMIRPQMTRAKEQQSFSGSLERGKEVVTNGGIIGKINKIEGQVVTLEVDKNTFLRVTKGSIDKGLTDSYSKIDTTEKV